MSSSEKDKSVRAEVSRARAGKRSTARESAPVDASGGAGDDTPAEEFGGPKGPEPTRFGDWERKGRCVDF